MVSVDTSSQNEISVNCIEDDNEVLFCGETNTRLSERREPPIRTLPTIPLLVTYVLLLIGMAIIPYLLPVICPPTSCPVTPISLLVYLQAFLWLLFIGFQVIISKEHCKLRNYGYLLFYRRSRAYVRAPLIIWSLGNVALLYIMATLQRHCLNKVESPHATSTVTMLDLAKIIVALETLAAFVVLLKILVETVRFNRLRAYPDVQEEEGMPSASNSQTTDDLGYRDGSPLTEVLERQNDLIQYLRHHNRQLGQQLYQLQQQLENSQRRKVNPRC